MKTVVCTLSYYYYKVFHVDSRVHNILMLFLCPYCCRVVVVVDIIVVVIIVIGDVIVVVEELLLLL